MQDHDDIHRPEDETCDVAGRALAHSLARLQVSLTRDIVRARLFDDVGPRIGRFELQRTLGRGATGTVFLALDREFDRRVAVKVLGIDRDPDPERLEVRWEREARALARVSHPNVVQLYERGNHDGQFFLAMEYVRGCTLSSWLRRPRTPDAIVSTFVQVGRGLQAAHRVGLLHRDFKPDNVIVGQDGRPRIVDFGIACVPDDARGSEESFTWWAKVDAIASRTASIAGTPAYMSPEQCRGEAMDARSDQFSFCVALYEALFGRAPYEEKHLGRLLYERASGRLHPVPVDLNVAAHVRAAITRGLSPDPRDRWPSMQAMLSALASAPAKPPRARLRRLPGYVMIGLSLSAMLSTSCHTLVEESDTRAEPLESACIVGRPPSRGREPHELGHQPRAIADP